MSRRPLAPDLPRVYWLFMGRILSSIVFVAAAVIVLWAIGRMVGFEMSLMSSLAISIVLTLVLNLGLSAFGRRRNRIRY